MKSLRFWKDNKMEDQIIKETRNLFAFKRKIYETTVTEIRNFTRLKIKNSTKEKLRH